jgi:hypothetical protein
VVEGHTMKVNFELQHRIFDQGDVVICHHPEPTTDSRASEATPGIHRENEQEQGALTHR